MHDRFFCCLKFEKYRCTHSQVIGQLGFHRLRLYLEPSMHAIGVKNMTSNNVVYACMFEKGK